MVLGHLFEGIYYTHLDLSTGNQTFRLLATFSQAGILLGLENLTTKTTYLGSVAKGPWRLIFTRGQEKECPIYATDCKPNIVPEGEKKLRFSYDSMIYKGSKLPVRLEYTVELKEDELISYFPTIFFSKGNN